MYGQWDVGPYPRGANAGDHGLASAHVAPHLDRLFVVCKGLIDRIKGTSKLKFKYVKESINFHSCYKKEHEYETG